MKRLAAPMSKTDQLCDNVRRMSVTLHKQTSCKKKIKRVLIAAEKLNKLLDDVTVLVQDLEVLFPNAEAARQRLATQTAEGFSKEEAAELLSEIKKVAAELKVGGRLLKEVLTGKAEGGSKPASGGGVTNHWEPTTPGSRSERWKAAISTSGSAGSEV